MASKVPLRAHTVLIYAVKKKAIRSSRWQLKVVYAVLIADQTSSARQAALPEDEIREGRFIRPRWRPICRADGILTGIMKLRKHLKEPTTSKRPSVDSQFYLHRISQDPTEIIPRISIWSVIIFVIFQCITQQIIRPMVNN